MTDINIDGSIFGTMIIAGANKLQKEKTYIDNLNVFPVPDGDTGTNMSLTLLSAAKAVKKLSGEAGLDEVAQAMSYGALMGARGNSGVILSQLLSGFAKYLKNQSTLEAGNLAEAFSLGVKEAYQAVANPIEGTILTVARQASEKLSSEVNEDLSIVEAFEILLKEGYKSLAKTPDMLPVLKQAGVVDAGGQGLLTMLEGMLTVLKGDEIDNNLTLESAASKEAKYSEANYQQVNLDFPYCTEFIINDLKTTFDYDKTREFLLSVGDSVVLVEQEDLIKIHVHTDNPGKVLDFAIGIGSLNNIMIDNMSIQSQSKEISIPLQNIGIIAVSSGEGINNILTSLGVDYIIQGGQSMNPSTEDILAAINSTNAKEIIILPNNKNIVLAAEQAVKLANKPSGLVATTSIPQAIAALMAFNGENDFKINIQKMSENISSIKTAEVTYAVRDAIQDDLHIKKHQIIGITEGVITYISEDISDVVETIVQQLIEDDEELITIYYGQEIFKEDAEKLINHLAQKYDHLDFELHFGGQPLYYYLISAE